MKIKKKKTPNFYAVKNVVRRRARNSVIIIYLYVLVREVADTIRIIQRDNKTRRGKKRPSGRAKRKPL